MARMMTIAELRKELAAKKNQLAKLRTQRDKIAKQLAVVDRRIAALDGEPVDAMPKRGKTAKMKPAVKMARRTRGGSSLAGVLAQALAGKGNVKVADATKLAVASGYKTKSANFGNIVSQMLSSDTRFRKVSRGVYAFQKAGKAAGKGSPKPAEKKAKASAKSPKGAASLPQALAKAMAGKGSMGAKDAMNAVLAAGYQTKAKDFRSIVSRALAAGKQFKKVSRGVYALKG
jgi:hypothetical protein